MRKKRRQGTNRAGLGEKEPESGKNNLEDIMGKVMGSRGKFKGKRLTSIRQKVRKREL